MTAELERLAWYGDPESLDLRDALAIKHGCRPSTDRRGRGDRRLMGLAVRAFVPPRRRGANDARNVSDVQLSRDRLRRNAGVCRLSRRTANPISTRLLRIARERKRLASCTSPTPTIRADVLRARRRSRGFARRCRDDALFMLDEAYADFVERGRAAADCHRRPDRSGCARSRKRTAWPERASATRCSPKRTRRRFRRFGCITAINRNAQIGALASLADDAFRERVVRGDRAGARRLLRARARTRLRLYRVAYELRVHRHRNARARRRA